MMSDDISEIRHSVKVAAVEEVEVAIVGAGFGGIVTMLKLKQAGISSVACFEKAHEVGGVWWFNTYPGCACDVPSHLYSISSEPAWDWTRRYAQHHEIQAYLKDVVTRNGFIDDGTIRCNTLVKDASWDDAKQRYVLQVHNTVSGRSSVVFARFLVMCMNPMQVPQIPNFPGLDSFEGTVMHTAAWDHKVQLEDKSVVVIGSGASAIQVVPAIAPVVKRLTVFQRTAPWVKPKKDSPFTDVERAAFKRFPELRRLYREHLYREAELTQEYIDPTSACNRAGAIECNRHRERQVTDRVLRAKLKPDFQFGCKRVLKSDDWYPALQRPNTTVVTEGVKEVIRNGVLDSHLNVHKADVIVMATGFSGSKSAGVNVKGRVDLRLRDHLVATDVASYWGTNYHGFPNLFTTLGPHTGNAHTSAVLFMEAQADYMVKIMQHMKQVGASVFEVKESPQARFTDEVNERLKSSAFLSGCNSWYISPNSKGTELRAHTIWPGKATEFTTRIQEIDLNNYVFQDEAGEAVMQSN